MEVSRCSENKFLVSSARLHKPLFLARLENAIYHVTGVASGLFKTEDGLTFR